MRVLQAASPWTLALAGLFAVACDGAVAVPADPIDDDFLAAGGKEDAFGVIDGSADAIGVLRVANELSQSKLAKTSGVGLGSRVAGNIVGARPFATLAKLDAVPYVGKSAFARLLGYARANGFVPADVASTTQGQRSVSADRVGWSGYWWSMLNGELALGWSDGHGRQVWTPAQVREFDACLSQTTATCERLLGDMGANMGRKLSPLMKFDLWARGELASRKGGIGQVAWSEFTHAARWELDNHYIGDNRDHRYWDSRGYAGKCIGWALATMFWDEPARELELGGVVFEPADLKGMLATIYNGAQFFVPEELSSGNAFHNNANSDSQAFYDDVLPREMFQALAVTLDQGKMIEADLEPGDGVWNYPIHAYDVSWKQVRPGTVSGTLVLHHANDEVAIDGVFSTVAGRPDLLTRELPFELTVPAGWDGDLASATASRWVGAAVDTHPDAVILGLEDGWRTTIYEYSGTQMKTEVNFQLIKRVKVGTKWVPLVDQLLASYYKQ